MCKAGQRQGIAAEIEFEHRLREESVAVFKCFTAIRDDVLQWF